MSHISLHDFVEPSWDAPLDMHKTLNAVPEDATITGMFLEPTAREARKKGKPLPSAREKYVSFRFYPLREHVQLLIEACAIFYPGRPPRAALRKLGRAGPNALLASTFGKVSVGSAQSTHAMLAALAKSYSVSMPGCNAEWTEVSSNACIVHMQNVPYFVDCHHVGVLEGLLRYAGVQGEVKVKTFGPTNSDLLCTWR